METASSRGEVDVSRSYFRGNQSEDENSGRARGRDAKKAGSRSVSTLRGGWNCGSRSRLDDWLDDDVVLREDRALRPAVFLVGDDVMLC